MLLLLLLVRSGPHNLRQRSVPLARLVIQLLPLDGLHQPPPTHDAGLPFRKIRPQIPLFPLGLGLTPRQLALHLLRCERELGGLLRGDALELFGLLLAQHVHPRGVQVVQAVALVALLGKLFVVVDRDITDGHAGHAAIAVGFHVAEARFAGAALLLQSADEVDFGGEVAVLKIAIEVDVTGGEIVVFLVVAVGYGAFGFADFEVDEPVLLLFEMQEASLLLKLMGAQFLEAVVLDAPLAGGP